MGESLVFDEYGGTLCAMLHLLPRMFENCQSV